MNKFMNKVKNKTLEKIKAKLRRKHDYSVLTNRVDGISKLYLRKYVCDTDEVLGIDIGVGRDKNLVYITYNRVTVKLTLEEFALIGDVTKELMCEREE